MGIMEMTLALMCLMAGTGCLVLMLLLQFGDIQTAAEYQVSPPKRGALLFLTLAGLVMAGALAVLAVEVQQLFTPAFS